MFTIVDSQSSKFHESAYRFSYWPEMNGKHMRKGFTDFIFQVSVDRRVYSVALASRTRHLRFWFGPVGMKRKGLHRLVSLNIFTGVQVDLLWKSFLPLLSPHFSPPPPFLPPSLQCRTLFSSLVPSNYLCGVTGLLR